ncbi:retrovirus-related pol polyprotein from transposon TNT 1-94, partial [Trifolium medium]|nr:retrovirus-related pol polyprotein from transposon TNT 1-94 [Trifolium medium]
MGNGTALPILSAGSSMFKSPNHTHIPLTLHNLLHVPYITKNLISGTNEVLIQGDVGVDGLYSFSNISIGPDKSSELHSAHKPS